MKKSVRNIATGLVLTSTVAYADMEVEIEFILQSDSTGMNTRNQGITADSDEVEIWLDDVELEIDPSSVDVESLLDLVEYSVQNFAFIEGEDIDPPYTEVKMEFSSEDREVEVSLRYAPGDMPQTLVTLQEDYLNEVWK